MLVVFIAHLPLVRMERHDDFPIGRGVLTKVPWEQYDSLTLGSFRDWKPKYEATEPVFFWFQTDIDLPFIYPGASEYGGMMESKLPRATWKDTLPSLGLEVINWFHDRLS